MAILNSILDNDLYKLTMLSVVLKHHNKQKVRCSFTDRGNTVYPDDFDKILMDEIKHMESLSLTSSEKQFLSKELKDELSPETIRFIEKYRYNSNVLTVWLDDKNHLHVEYESYWSDIIMFEVPLMSIISELFFKVTGQIVDLSSHELEELDKIKCEKMLSVNAPFVDMGTRRRYSYENHLRVLSNFKKYGGDSFKGTSNVHFAHILGLKCYGSIAHEMTMTMAAIYGYKLANTKTMEFWKDTHPDKLKTILPDTYPVSVFLKDFDKEYSEYFTSVRWDSGCPFEFTDTMISHFTKFGIDPTTKTIIYSDSLDCDLVIKIQHYREGRINSNYGIGTFFTNNLPNINALRIVIKVSHVLVNGVWIPAIKLSNDPSKYTGDKNEVDRCKHILNIK